MHEVADWKYGREEKKVAKGCKARETRKRHTASDSFCIQKEYVEKATGIRGRPQNKKPDHRANVVSEVCKDAMGRSVDRLRSRSY